MLAEYVLPRLLAHNLASASICTYTLPVHTRISFTITLPHLR